MSLALQVTLAGLHFFCFPMSTADSNPDTHPTTAAVGAAGADGIDTSSAGQEPSLEARLAAAEAKATEMNDAFLRSRAEVENIRRRSEEEMSKARKFAVEAFAEALLPVRDSLEAAIHQPHAKAELVLEGVQATLRQLAHAMERNKVMQINPEPGTKFDPHQHQAISMVPSEQESNTVVAVLQRGYLIAERVLRPALFPVSAPK